MATTALTFWSITLFKIGSLLLALILGLQLIRQQLPFDYDITRIFTFEQFVFIYVTLIVTFLALVEGVTLYRRNKESVVGAVILIIVFFIGLYFVGLIVLFDFSFNDSQTNAFLGYYLLFGTFLIFINARQIIFSRLFKNKE